MSKPWSEYFMEIAELVSQKSTCLRRQVGAVAVRDNRILATGYNGAPTKEPHCIDTGCIREQNNIPSGQQHELCRAVHAEQNVIIQASVHQVSLVGSTVCCTHMPCFICAKILVNAGVKKIVYKHYYPDLLTVNLLKDRLEKYPHDPN